MVVNVLTLMSTFDAGARFVREVVRVVALVEVVNMLALLSQILPDEPSNIPSLSAVEVLHSPQSVCVKDDAP